jgi:hypothetical protein
MNFTHKLLAVCCFLLAAPAVPAQQLPETKVVLRLSRDFVLRLTGINYQLDEPIQTNEGGNTIAGNAHINGKFDVKLYESATESNFDILVSGEILTQVTASRRAIEVRTHGRAPFSGQRHIVFNGTAYVGQDISMNVMHHSTLDAILSRRGGVAGALTRRIARPVARRALPESDRRADEELRSRLVKAFDEETTTLISVINKIGPIVKQAETLLIEEDLLPKSGLHLYRASTKESLLFSTGPAHQRIAKLPDIPAFKRAPVELWIAKREGSKEKRLQYFLKQWELIVPFLDEQLARRYPEFSKTFEGKLYKSLNKVQMETVGGWHVVTFAPQLRQLSIRDRP